MRFYAMKTPPEDACSEQKSTGRAKKTKMVRKCVVTSWLSGEIVGGHRNKVAECRIECILILLIKSLIWRTLVSDGRTDGRKVGGPYKGEMPAALSHRTTGRHLHGYIVVYSGSEIHPDRIGLRDRERLHHTADQPLSARTLVDLPSSDILSDLIFRRSYR